MISSFSSCGVKLRHDRDYSMLVCIATQTSILKCIHFEQYPSSRALSAEAIDLPDSVAKWLI